MAGPGARRRWKPRTTTQRLGGWAGPQARRGDPVIDLVTLLGSAAVDGWWTPVVVDAVLAAHTGFLRGALTPLPPGLAPIGEAKRRLGLAASGWLRRRLSSGRS